MFGLVCINLANAACIRYDTKTCNIFTTPLSRCIFGNGMSFQVVPCILILVFFHQFIFKFMAFKFHFARLFYVAYCVYILERYL